MTHTDPTLTQTHFRVRTDDTIGLNTDSGWEEAEDTDATIPFGQLFRIRFRIACTGANHAGAFKIQYNRNSGGWVDCSWSDEKIAVEPAEIWWSEQFTDGAATSSALLTGAETYVNGEGKGNNITTGSISIAVGEATELEYAIFLHHHWDGPTFATTGTDTIDFRIVESDGTVFTGTYVNPTITVAANAGYIGGCHPETTDNWGPVADSNGNLYVFIEVSESDNKLMCMKSADGGDSWAEVDGTNRPTTTDIEAVSLWVETDTIHIIHQPSEVVYHAFRMSDHPTNADTWEITDEVVIATTGETDQSASLVVRSDSTVVACYRSDDGTNQRIKYKIRSSGGTWGSENELDSTASTEIVGVRMQRMDGSDWIAIIYQDETNADIFVRYMDPADDSLTTRATIETNSNSSGSGQPIAFTNAVSWDNSGTKELMVAVQDHTDKKLYTVVASDRGTPDTRKAASDDAVLYDGNDSGPFRTGHVGITSRQPAARLVLDGTDVYLIYASTVDNNIMRDKAENDGGWGTDAVQLATTRGLDTLSATVFTHSSGNGGDKVVGIFYSHAADNFNGWLYYTEYVIPSVGGTGQPLALRTSHIRHMNQVQPGRRG